MVYLFHYLNPYLLIHYFVHFIFTVAMLIVVVINIYQPPIAATKATINHWPTQISTDYLYYMYFIFILSFIKY